MHIPDGYLSPATCAALYAGAAPFWYVALRRVKRLLHTRLVPHLSVFAAFSFVIMMFNLPLPGGTTGHAVGVGIATIVLGPWGSMLAISVALLIQALFFGDGGVTAFGANAFNMGVVGSLVAYAVYRAVAGRAALTAPRRGFAPRLRSPATRRSTLRPCAPRLSSAFSRCFSTTRVERRSMRPILCASQSRP